MRPADQAEFAPDLVEAVNEAWKGAECRCFRDGSTCVTCSSVAILRVLRHKGRLVPSIDDMAEWELEYLDSPDYLAAKKALKSADEKE